MIAGTILSKTGTIVPVNKTWNVYCVQFAKKRDDVTQLEESILFNPTSLSPMVSSCDHCGFPGSLTRNKIPWRWVVKEVLPDGQRMGECVLLAEAKLGELLNKLEKKPIVEPNPEGSLKGTIRVLPVGINKKESHQAREILRNPGTRTDLGTIVPKLKTWRSFN